KGRLSEYVQSPEFIAIIGGAEARPAAMADAAQLRELGYQVDYPLKNQGFGKQFKAVTQSGARFALIYGSEEIEKGVVKVRDLSAEEEVELPREHLAQAAPELLASGLAAIK
ncbi:MAG: His/Gly/Thr/Pro-type tRNA ligase C-terminal domain-containing protein, partial [Coraliomargarita sp.]